MRQPDVTTDGRVVANGDATQYRSVRIYRHVVFDNRVTRYIQHVAVSIILEALGTQCDTLIQRDVVANDTRLTNHDTRAVVDGEVLADGGTRMDIDTRLGVGLLGNDTRNDGHRSLSNIAWMSV